MKIKNELRKHCLGKTSSRGGQIAVLLVFFVAILLAALAVVINLQNISLRKTTAVVAVDSAAAFMASMYASYAEAQYQSIIEPGKNKEGTELTRSATPAWIQQAVAIIVAVVGLIVAIICYIIPGGQPAGLALTFVVVAAISVALSVTMLVLELAYVMPQQRQMWGQMFQYLKTYDRFREQGIQSLFSYTATDSVKVKDKNDYNMDGYYEGDGLGPEAKEVSRFSVLYTRRAEYLQAKNDVDLIGLNDGRVIYAWQDKDKPGQPAGSGKWHITRAEVGVPMRCNGKCARTSCNSTDINVPWWVPGGDIIDPYTGNNCPEPYLPWVKNWGYTFTDYWSLIDCVNKDDEAQKRGVCGIERYDPVTVTDYGKATYKAWQICFKGGLVMARVNRYDEGGGILNWATGFVFWENRFKNINATGPGNPDKIEEKCGNIMKYANTQNCTNWVKSAPQDMGAFTPDCGISWGMPGAFVLNEETFENRECWQLMHQLLNQGTEARSCAEYFFRDNANADHNCTSAFGVKFVQCPPRW